MGQIVCTLGIKKVLCVITCSVSNCYLKKSSLIWNHVKLYIKIMLIYFPVFLCKRSWNVLNSLVLEFFLKDLQNLLKKTIWLTLSLFHENFPMWLEFLPLFEGNFWAPQPNIIFWQSQFNMDYFLDSEKLSRWVQSVYFIQKTYLNDVH